MLDVALKRRLGSIDLSVAFTADRGVTALFGVSGAGKSSVIEMLAGLMRPDAGHIRLAGELLYDHARGIDIPPHQRGIGYVFQDHRLFPHLSVDANLRYGERFASTRRSVADFDSVVQLLGLESLLDRRPGRLSGGEKQRVAIGRALLSRPRLLLMDEPLAALDRARKAEILPYLETLCSTLHLPVVYVSHALDEVIRLADTLVVLDHGRVVASGNTETLLGRLDLPQLSQDEDGPACLVRGVITAADAGHGLCRVHFDGGDLLLPASGRPTGQSVRVRIAARDVALARSPPPDISTQNILAGHIAEISPERSGLRDVAVTLGTLRIIARLTDLACERLRLHPGDPIYALIRTAALVQ